MPSVALIGAGLFAKDVWLRTIGAHADAQFAAIWSRSEETCASLHSNLSDELKTSVKKLHGEDGLLALLSDTSIDAVIVCLPPAPALEIVKRFLEAGKAVACEKPIAASCSDVAEMLQSYQSGTIRQRSNGLPPLWQILENYRYESCFQQMINLLPACGRIIKLDLVAEMSMVRQSALLLLLLLICFSCLTPSLYYLGSQQQVLLISVEKRFCPTAP